MSAEAYNIPGYGEIDVTNIKPNTEITGRLTAAGYHRTAYKVELTNDSKISLTFKHDAVSDPDDCFQVSVYNDSVDFGAPVFYATFQGNKTTQTSCNCGLKKGKYDIVIYSPNSFSKRFKMTLNASATSSWEKEFNDNGKYATKIDFNKEYWGVTNNDMNGYDCDYYKFTLNSKRNIRIRFKHNKTAYTMPNWRASLYNSNDSSEFNLFDDIFYINGNAPDVVSKTVSLNSGTYYVRVDAEKLSTADYRIIVEDMSTPAPKITSGTAISLGKGETKKLTADMPVTWRTSNSKILTVDKNGNVKAVGTGVAWITAKASSGKESSCKITVKNEPKKVSLSKGDFAMGVGETFTLSAVLPDNTASAKRTFRTSNSSVIKMTKTDWTGSFKAMKTGTAWVTVRLYNGVEKSCKITVKPAPTNVYVNKKTINLKVGQTAKLSAYLNNGAACATRTFRSSAPSIIKMTKTNWEGEFKAMKKGVAWVTVRTYNGKEASCKVTVS